MPTPLERDLIALVKLARRKDIRPHFIAMRDLHGKDVVAAKLDQCFSPEGARDLLLWLNETDAEKPPVDPPSPPAGPLDEYDITGAPGYYKGRKETPSAATIDKALFVAKIEGGNVRLDYEKLTGWRVDRGEKDLDGHVCIAFKGPDGNVIAGRFDHKKVGQTVKTLGNIPGGIISVNGRSYQPAKGETVGFFVLDRTGKLRTNTVKAVWR